MPHRAPVTAILGLVDAGEAITAVADEVGLTAEEVGVLVQFAEQIREAT
jgi:uncharacterized protein (DUF433 family)